MKLTLERTFGDSRGTYGIMSINHLSFCYTLERPPEPLNMPNKSCVLAGTYNLVQREQSPMADKQAAWYSNSDERVLFGSGMIEIAGIPDRTTILIHPGNRIDEIRGCVMVGAQILKTQTGFALRQSRGVYEWLYRNVMPFVKAGNSQIKIVWVDGQRGDVAKV